MSILGCVGNSSTRPLLQFQLVSHPTCFTSSTMSNIQDTITNGHTETNGASEGAIASRDVSPAPPVSIPPSQPPPPSADEPMVTVSDLLQDPLFGLAPGINADAEGPLRAYLEDIPRPEPNGEWDVTMCELWVETGTVSEVLLYYIVDVTNYTNRTQ